MTTSIEWTATRNPDGTVTRGYTCNPGIYGCEEVSPACANCYAAKMAHRQVAMGNYPGGITVKRASGVHWSGEVKVDYDAIAPAFAKLPKKKPAKVFLTSMADLFHKDVPFGFIQRVFWAMACRPHLTFLVLTKRPERAAQFTEWLRSRNELWTSRGMVSSWPFNVWAGTTVEDQKRADERIPWLLKVPASVKFLSMEPLLGAVDFHAVDVAVSDSIDPEWRDGRRGHVIVHVLGDADGIDWVIAGGESGPKARPTHPDWFRGIRDQCAEADVPFHFKQWGAFGPWDPKVRPSSDSDPVVYHDERGGFDYGFLEAGRPHSFMARVGKKIAGRLLDGVQHDGVPS